MQLPGWHSVGIPICMIEDHASWQLRSNYLGSQDSKSHWEKIIIWSDLGSCYATARMVSRRDTYSDYSVIYVIYGSTCHKMCVFTVYHNIILFIF